MPATPDLERAIRGKLLPKLRLVAKNRTAPRASQSNRIVPRYTRARAASRAVHPHNILGGYDLQTRRGRHFGGTNMPRVRATKKDRGSGHPPDPMDVNARLCVCVLNRAGRRNWPAGSSERRNEACIHYSEDFRLSLALFPNP